MTKKPKRSPARSAATPDVSALQRALVRLRKARLTDARRHTRRLAAVRREADRRLAAMVHEIATLRHHEARAQALERLLADRESQIASLVSSLEKATAPAPV